jgi:hypothetical protein
MYLKTPEKTFPFYTLDFTSLSVFESKDRQYALASLNGGNPGQALPDHFTVIDEAEYTELLGPVEPIPDPEPESPPLLPPEQVNAFLATVGELQDFHDSLKDVLE